MVYPEFHGVSDVSSYLETLDIATLSEIRAIVDRAASIAREHGDGLGESVSYGMPCLTWHDKPLIAVIASKKHIGIYPYSGAIIDVIRTELNADGIPATMGAIQLPYGTALADSHVRAIIEAKIAAIDS